jgi:hypothetical protein
LRKKHTDYLTFTGEHIFTLREYPVCKVLSVHAATAGAALRGETLFSDESLVDPKHYIASPMRVSMRIFLFLWFFGLPCGYPVMKCLSRYGTYQVMRRARLRLIWPPLVWNWRPGI